MIKEPAKPFASGARDRDTDALTLDSAISPLRLTLAGAGFSSHSRDSVLCLIPPRGLSAEHRPDRLPRRVGEEVEVLPPWPASVWAQYGVVLLEPFLKHVPERVGHRNRA